MTMGDVAAQPALVLEMSSDPKLLAAARAMIGKLAERLGFADSQAAQIALALDEALCNIINHGYNRRSDGRIWVRVWPSDGDAAGIRIVIEDLARQVDPSSIRSRDLDDVRPGGLGVHIIRESMDHVQYEKREGGGMRLTIVKHLVNENEPTASARGAPQSRSSAIGDPGAPVEQRTHKR